MSSYDIDERALAQMITRRVRLVRKGLQWVGLCPFHKEKTPSFTIFRGKTGKGLYHCFGCGAHGDSIDWLRNVEGQSYRQALGEDDDPEMGAALEGARRYEERRQCILQRYRDANPDCCMPDWALDTEQGYNWRRESP